MKNDFKKAKEEILKAGLTVSEKKLMVHKIMANGAIEVIAQTAPIKSPWTTFSFISWFRNNRMASSIISAVLIIVLLGTGVSYAAVGSLPGNTLYPIKTNIIEPIQVALAPTSEAKAQVEASLTERRLQEAQTLASSGNLDVNKEKQIITLIDEHTNALSADLAKVQVVSPDAANKIRGDFRMAMDKGAKVLEQVSTAPIQVEVQPTVTQPAAAPVQVNTQPTETRPTGNMPTETRLMSVPATGAGSAPETNSGRNNSDNSRNNSENNRNVEIRSVAPMSAPAVGAPATVPVSSPAPVSAPVSTPTVQAPEQVSAPESVTTPVENQQGNGETRASNPTNEGAQVIVVPPEVTQSKKGSASIAEKAREVSKRIESVGKDNNNKDGNGNGKGGKGD